MTEERLQCDDCNALIAVLREDTLPGYERYARRRKRIHEQTCDEGGDYNEGSTHE